MDNNVSTWVQIITGLIAIVGAGSWVPILMDKCKKREVRASLIHCRFFDDFSIPILPPGYITKINNTLVNNTDINFPKYEGALIVIGINICSIHKDFVVDNVEATLKMDKSEHSAILVSPDVLVQYLCGQDKATRARLSIPSSLDISKMKNVQANINTRLYMAFVCKDLKELKYDVFENLQIKLTDIKGKIFEMNIDKNQIEKASLIRDRDIYDVEYLARIGYRKLYETIDDLKILQEITAKVATKADGEEKNEAQV